MDKDTNVKYKNELKKLNLKTTDDLKYLLIPLLKDAYKIILRKKKNIPDGSNLKSHIGGQPYFEKNEMWPKAKNGKELDFVFQIFNNDSHILPKKIKLIQFFYDFEKSTYSSKYDGQLIKIYEELDIKNIAAIKRKSKKNNVLNYCEIEYKNIKSLPVPYEIAKYDKKIEMLSCMLNKEDPWNDYLVKYELTDGETCLYSQIGGYADWISYNEMPKGYKFIMQIKSEKAANLEWRIGGTMYFFYNSKSKKAKFVLQHI
ncbi:MAG: DUF1963 domain-containing protein [Treponema sp.]|jgi:uncharacterized protein YwqG|nr:DUF1963 domain-containing protein [Treponema sp.]